MINCDDSLGFILHKMIFEISSKKYCGSFSLKVEEFSPELKELEAPKSKYHCIITIVDKNKGKEVVKSALDAQASNYLIIKGRGAGVPVNYYFPLAIEPQKEVVLLIVPDENLYILKNKITKELELEKIGNGIIFSMGVSRATNIFVKEEK
jgi:nitrogen regulatory protein PII